MTQTKQSSLPANIAFYLGLITFGLGLTLLGFEEFTIKSIIILIGAIIGAGGLIIFIYRLKRRCNTRIAQIFQITTAVISFLFGLSLILFPKFYVEVTILIFGISMILGGIAMLVTALSFTPLSNIAKFFIGLSVLMIVTGSIFIFNPFETATAIATFAGITFTLFGITNIIMSFWIRVNIVKIRRQAKRGYSKTPKRQTVDAEVISVENVEESE